MKPMMACGHAQIGTHTNNHDDLGPDHPSCIICSTCVIVPQPDLMDRTAICLDLIKGNHKPRPSSNGLAFFEYRGPGSRFTLESCVCGMSRNIHADQPDIPEYNVKYDRIVRHEFRARTPAEYDSYYCGCRGWD